MRSLAILAICGLVGYWVYTQYQLDNRYYDSLTKNGEEHTIFERLAFALQREHSLEISKDEVILNKLEKGEITISEYQSYYDEKSQRQQKETNQAIEDLSNMYDPEKGMFSGLIKMSNSVKNLKKEQILKLDRKIDEIVDNIDIDKPDLSITKLSTISWRPVGDKQIDSEMTDYYKNKIETVKRQVNQIQSVTPN
jgi:hypothetical protein